MEELWIRTQMLDTTMRQLNRNFRPEVHDQTQNKLLVKKRMNTECGDAWHTELSRLQWSSLLDLSSHSSFLGYLMTVLFKFEFKMLQSSERKSLNRRRPDYNLNCRSKRQELSLSLWKTALISKLSKSGDKRSSVGSPLCPWRRSWLLLNSSYKETRESFFLPL